VDARQQLLLSRFSRRTALKAAGIGAAAFTLAQRNVIRALAQESDSIQDILDITATTERFGVTLLGEALASNAAGFYDVPFPDVVVAVLTAARAQEQFHLDAFEALGGKPLTDTFTVPKAVLINFETFFTALTEQEGREIAAQIAAMKTFAERGHPDLAKVSFQYAAEEAEHRLLANYTLGTRPANDRAFADNLYVTIDDFYQSLEEAGIIGGSGTEITYPGPGEFDDSNVIETEPGGPEASCNASATPAAGGESEESEDESTPTS